MPTNGVAAIAVLAYVADRRWPDRVSAEHGRRRGIEDERAGLKKRMGR